MFNVAPFHIDFCGEILKSSGFNLKDGDIALLYGDSSSRSDDMCLLLAGLLARFSRTMPAPEGHIVRRHNEIASEDLKGFILDDECIYQLNDIERAQKIGVIFGDPSDYLIGDTVWEEFCFAFAAAKLPVPDIQSLKRYGLYSNGLTTRATEVLSGGERYRLNIASVIEIQPRLLIADLSRCNLDVDFLESFGKWLNEDRAKRITIIYGVRPDTFDIENVVNMVVTNGELVIADPDQNLYPNIIDECKILKSALLDRCVNDNILLDVDMLCRTGITRPVRFKLHEREILQIRGSNGVGKTTLGKILVQWLRGKDVTGCTYPSLEMFSPVLSLQLPSRFFLLESSVKKMLNNKTFEICGLSNNREMNPRMLSFSKQKLLSTAIALEKSKEFVVFDEPTAGMDFDDKVRFINLLNEYKDISAILFTHDTALDGIGTIKTWEEISL